MSKLKFAEIVALAVTALAAAARAVIKFVEYICKLKPADNTA